jgi:hypothetical protein
MPAQVAVLSRKVLLDQSTVTYKSEPMNWAGFKRADMYLEVHGIPLNVNAALSFEGSAQPGENAVWTTMSAPAAYTDPSALTAIGVNRYVRSELFPYVRAVVTIGGAAALKMAEVSVGGQLYEDGL